MCAVPAWAAGMSPKERSELVRHLEASGRGFPEAVAGLSARQLNHRPSPESWTVLECAEHIAISEDNMFEEFQREYLPLAPKAGVKSPTPDGTVLEYGTDRSRQRMKAAAAYQPSGRWRSLDEMLQHFRRSRAKTLEYVRTTDDDLRGRYLEKMKLDAWQWLLILSAHTARHTLQIREIVASPGFPR
jgi:hypothetical protein